MHTRRLTLHRIVSVFVVLSILATSFGIHPPRPVAAAAPRPDRLRLYLPLRLRQQGGGGTYRIYLPVIIRLYHPLYPSELVLTPGTGGVIGSGDGQVRVVFDPEAVTQTIRVRYRPIKPPSLPPDNLAVAGPAFEITA